MYSQSPIQRSINRSHQKTNHTSCPSSPSKKRSTTHPTEPASTRALGAPDAGTPLSLSRLERGLSKPSNSNSRHLVKMLFAVAFLMISTFASAQQMTYRVVDKDINTYRGSIQFRVPLTLNSYNGIGLNAGAQAEYRLPVLPLTVRGHFEIEIGGLGEGSGISEGGGRFREIDAGVMYPLIGGRAKDGKVKMILDAGSNSTSYWEKFIYTEGQIKNEILARGGLFHWGVGRWRATGFSAGIAFRKRQHSSVKFTENPDYTYSTYKHLVIYADALVLPVQNVTDPEFNVRSDPFPWGFRIGAAVEWESSNAIYYEIGVRPAPNNVAFGFLNIGYTFGWGLK